MKKFAFLLMTATCFGFFCLPGCGDSGSKVIEAPVEVEEVDEAMGDMTEEEYNKAMEESMK
jgi:hypothetical protein